MGYNYKKEILSFVEKLLMKDNKFLIEVKKLIERIENGNNDLNKNKKSDSKIFLDIDVLDKVITNKELLKNDLAELKLTDLKQIIKKYNFNENANINKIKDKEIVLEYILSEAERRMNGYSIL